MPRLRPRISCLLCLITALLSLVTILPAQASTVEELEFREVVTESELIFEGRVTSIEARQTGPRAIHSFVEFEILSIIKGAYSEDHIELRFLGGSAGGRQLQVGEMELPEVGETGFYFVESLSRNLVHPLVGWTQGHYLIHQDALGVDRVTTADNQLIEEIQQPAEGQNQNQSEIRLTQPMVKESRKFSQGVAKGVIVQELRESSDTMTAEQFRASIQEQLNAGGSGR